MAILNVTITTATDGAQSIGAKEERSMLQTVGDLLISPVADIMAKDDQYVQKRTRGQAAALGLGLGVAVGEWWGHKRERAGKGALVPFLKV